MTNNMTSTPVFVWFEFDNQVALLHQSMSADVPNQSFAYQHKIRQLIAESQKPWTTNLDSLKLIDALLSSIKADLNSRQISEDRVLNHDEFIKLLMVLIFHTVKVLEQELGRYLKDAKTQMYVAQGFSKVYARCFAGVKDVQLSGGELDTFYQGFFVHGFGVNALRKNVAQNFFVLSAIGSRLFGSLDRVFRGLDNDGSPSDALEDSLYWAVSDYLQQFLSLGDETAKQLFQSVPTLNSDIDDIGLEDDTPTDSTAEPVMVIEPAKAVQAVQAVPTPTSSFDLEPHPQAPQDVSHQAPQNQTAPQTPSQNKPQAKLSASDKKQKARSSHTPKLFDEAYQDLMTMSMPSDTNDSYQKAVSVLSRFDEHIKSEMAKGKALDEISFGENQQAIRKNALQLLVSLVKNGNMSAMTRLALYFFEGRGVPSDPQKAVALIKKSAEMGDPRAQKLLSRLYYQGYDGIERSQEMGEYWLKKAADNGHIEAKKVCAYMNQVEILKSDRRTEQQSDKRLWMILGGVGVAVVLVLIIINALF
jgi:TPR repeat protein